MGYEVRKRGNKVICILRSLMLTVSLRELEGPMELLGKSNEELREYCAALRERLAKEARVTLPEVKQRFASADGSVRYLYSLPTGEGQETARPASVEAVFMPSEGRQTICISTQAGCAVDCHFCLTAQLGLIRNLTAGEILA